MFDQPLDKILCKNKICSMRSSSSFLKKHDVKVNGTRISDTSFPVDVETDEISVDGTLLNKVKHVYLMMNKGLGTVCSRSSDSHKVIYDFFPSELAKDLHSCGRLDADSTGLIFLTNNGTFSHFFESPETHLDKTYLVELKNDVLDSEKDSYIKAFQKGIFLPPFKKGSGFTTKPAVLSFESARGCKVVITEGKFRQIRRMFAALGNEVVSLKRIAIGPVVLDAALGENEWRELNEDEKKKLNP
ncbi:MAG: rRNA pseudouridine synthase [Treponemataceae bacterium]|nr:rRNA pseudouridine synthase [Treponemataceae bacterium]